MKELEGCSAERMDDLSMGFACVIESVRKLIMRVSMAIDVTAFFFNMMLPRGVIGVQVVKSLD